MLGFVLYQGFSQAVKGWKENWAEERVREPGSTKFSPAGTAENRPRRYPAQPSAVPAGLILETLFSRTFLRQVFPRPPQPTEFSVHLHFFEDLKTRRKRLPSFRAKLDDAPCRSSG
jgi:hypothetical protein